MTRGGWASLLLLACGSAAQPLDPAPAPAVEVPPAVEAPALDPVPAVEAPARVGATPEDPDWIQALATDPSVTDAQLDRVRALVAGNPLIGTGRPGVTTHPMQPAECVARRAAAGVPATSPDADRCGHPHRVRAPAEAAVCIDQYEFPGVPCAYPLIWVRANEAAALCEAVGKRLCDAAEWEDACAGSLGPPEDLGRVAGMEPAAAQRALRTARNAQVDTTWAYGPTRRAGICAMGSTKNHGCDGSDPRACGSNTYPTGAFPECAGPFGVYDLHGNAAEHMSLPLRPEQRGNATGVTEMKGSWFIFDSYQAHADHCRWRAPFWHGGPVQAADSHRNYHLGFRCCADLPGAP